MKAPAPPSATELGDLSDMPRDPRWRCAENGTLVHHRYPGDCGIVIPAGPDQERNRALTDFYHAYYSAARLMERLKPKQTKRSKPSKPVAVAPVAVQRFEQMELTL